MEIIQLKKKQGGSKMAKTLRGQRFNKIIYYSIGGAILALILLIVFINSIGSKKNKADNIQIGEKESEKIVVEEANSPVGKNVEQVKNSEDENLEVKVENKETTETANSNTTNLELGNNSEENIEDNSNNVVETGTVENNEVQENQANLAEKDPIFAKPVEGEVIKTYGKEKLIYSNTLKEWTTHLGIDIKADKTTVVKASADGVVKSIKNDPRYGLTVVLDHKNGFSSVYSNLLTAEFVVVGENVKAGQTLGTVGNSATFEILDEPHLHFEILKDGAAVDPEMYVK